MAVKCVCEQEAEERQRGAGGRGRKRESLPWPWADNGLREEITAPSALLRPAVGRFLRCRGSAPKRPERGGQEIPATSGQFLHSEASLHRGSVPSGYAFLSRGMGWDWQSMRREQKVGKRKTERREPSSLLPGSRQAETDAVPVLYSQLSEKAALC